MRVRSDPEWAQEGVYSHMDHAESLSPAGLRAGGRPGSDLSDETLLSLSAQGDLPAWEQIVDRYLASMWAAVTVSGVDTPTAHSIVEMVWLRLSQRLDAPPALLRPWLLDAVDDATRHVVGRRASDRKAVNPRDSLGAVPYPR